MEDALSTVLFDKNVCVNVQEQYQVKIPLTLYNKDTGNHFNQAFLCLPKLTLTKEAFYRSGRVCITEI